MAARHIFSLEQISSAYQRIYCDIWGVVHNGLAQNQTAVQALKNFRDMGGQVALVTNAPRPSQYVQDMLDGFGVLRDAYDCIVTSGDVTRDLIAPYRGKTIHHVGPDYDRNLFDGTGVIFGSAQQAQILVVSDMDEKGEDILIYSDRLQEWKSLGLTMICANPDKVVEVGDQLVYCGGALADLYEEAGGDVKMAGKPFPQIYQAADTRLLKLGLPDVRKDQTLAIGDAARTDAMGAANQGVDFLFVTGSIHADELHADSADANRADPDVVAQLLAPTRVKIAGYMKSLN